MRSHATVRSTATVAETKAQKFRREYHSRERVRFVAALACVVCASSPCENHHIRGDGLARKGPYTAIVPLCAGCHRRWHTIGKLSLLQAEAPLAWRGRYWEQWDDVAEEVERLWRAR